eukprot:gene1737-33147_t
MHDAKVILGIRLFANARFLITVCWCRSRSLASKTNGGTTTFPYCGCYEASCGVKVDSFVVSDPSDEVQQLSFRITADADCPRTNRKCSQDLRKIEINSFEYCRWTRMDVTLNGNFLPYNFDNQGMQDYVPGVQILKLYGLTLTYADLAAAPAMINITLHPERDGVDRQCPTFEQLLNTTATPGSPIMLLPAPGVSSQNRPLESQDCAVLINYLNSGGCAEVPLPGLGEFICTMEPQIVVVSGRNLSMMSVCASGDTDANAWLASIDDVCAATILGGGLDYTEQCDIILEAASSCGGSYRFSQQCQLAEVDFPHTCYPGNSVLNGGRRTGERLRVAPSYLSEPVAVGTTHLNFTIVPDASGWQVTRLRAQVEGDPKQACMTISVLLPAPGVSSQNRPLESQDCAVLINYLNSGGCAEAPLPGLGEFICTMEPQIVVVSGRNLSMMSVCAAGDTDANAWLASIDDVCAATILAGALDYTEQCDIILEAASSCGGSYRFSQQCQLAEVDFPHTCYPGNSVLNGGRGTGEQLRGAPYYVSDPVAVGTTFNFTIVQDASGCTDFEPKGGGLLSSCCQMSIDKIEMVINPQCRGEIKSISVNGQARSSSYSNSSYINMPEFTPAGYPDPQPWYQVFKKHHDSEQLVFIFLFSPWMFPSPLCAVLLPAPGVSSQNRPLESLDCAVLINYLNSGGCAQAPLPGLGEFICTMEPQIVVVSGRNLSMMSVCAAGNTDANAWLASIDDVCAATILARALDYTEQCDIILEAASSCGGSYRFSQQCQLAEVDFPHTCYPGNSAFNGGRGTGERLRGAPYYVSEPVAVGTTFNFTIVQDASGCTEFEPKGGGPPSSCCQMSIDKIEMVINPECRGEIKSISVNGQTRSSSYSNSSYINMPEFTPVGYPDPQPWYQVFK